MGNTAFVNVFQGVGQSVTPESGSLFSKWNLLKGKAGNVSPAACLPFGAVACSPYSGGYSSGYGNYKPNGNRPPEKFFDGNKLIGFSHFTHSGSGAFGFYYNYLVVTPYVDNESAIPQLKDFDEEYAEPGYYSCRLTEEDIKCEVTVSEKVALHRYTAADGKKLKIAIDVSNDGLRQNNPRLFGVSSESKLKLYSDGKAGGYVTMQGVKIYFYIICSDRLAAQRILIDGEKTTQAEFISAETQTVFGCMFETEKNVVELKIGFSLVSETNAMASVLTSREFVGAKKIASELWSEKLSGIQIDGITDQEREIFYSNYYHSLVKPCGWEKESFLWSEKQTFYLDFATLWDVYKTQMPLIFALYKDEGRGIIKTLLRYGKEKGKLFNALMLSSNENIESTQACCLGCYVLYDGYAYGLVEKSEIDDLFAVVKSEIGQYSETVLTGNMEKTTKLLDCTLIAAAYANLAKRLGRISDEEYFSKIAEHWTDGFGKDGLLKENYPYYEGNRWNYSFRFVLDKEKRIAIGGGRERVEKQLDGFFAFTDENAQIDRFEGFNNETDMETPYFYHYVGRYDKLAKILKECRENCFKNGREGLPGNNDSGGLSACYLWNFLGLFPVSGQGELYFGVPRAKKATIRLSNGKTLTITALGDGEEIEKTEWNGEKVSDYKISVERLMQGGELTFYKR